MVRPKGKKYLPVTFTLTQEQIDYLKTQPNASELVRRILEDLIASRKSLQENLTTISLYRQLKMLEDEENKLVLERWNFIEGNKRFWKTTLGYDVEEGREADQADLDENRLPLLNEWNGQSEDGRIALQIVKDYSRALAAIKEEIKKLKAKILAKIDCLGESQDL